MFWLCNVVAGFIEADFDRLTCNQGARKVLDMSTQSKCRHWIGAPVLIWSCMLSFTEKSLVSFDYHYKSWSGLLILILDQSVIRDMVDL